MVGEKTGRDALWRARELSLAGLLGALGLLLPIGFHMLGWAGKVFQPMHLPILVAGFLLGPGTAAAVGLLTPLLSAVLTGMPPLSPPIAPLMSVELAAKAVVASLLYRRLRLPLWSVLPVAIVVDWIVLAAAAAAAGGFFRIEAAALTYVGLIIAVSWPGTLLQLFGAPLAVRTIERRVPRLAAQRRRP